MKTYSLFVFVVGFCALLQQCSRGETYLSKHDKACTHKVKINVTMYSDYGQPKTSQTQRCTPLIF